MKRYFSLFFAAVLLFGLVACATAGGNTPVEAGGTGAQAGARTFIDDAGRTVTLPDEITRVAPAGPIAQMYLVALAPELLVTVTSTLKDDQRQFLPERLQQLPVVGNFYGDADINLEEIAAIGPQLVIDVGEPKGSVAGDMDSVTEATAIPAVHIAADTVGAGEAFRRLGALLGLEERAEVLAAYCEESYQSFERLMASYADKPGILYCLGDRGTNVIAAGSYHSEILDMLGNNLAVVESPSSKGTGNEVDMEQLLVWNPDVIFFAPGSVYGEVAEDPVWQQLAAIQNGRYYQVPQGPYNWMGFPPSLNRYLGMLWGTSVLYGAQVDLYSGLEAAFRLFYHHELSEEEYHALVG